MEVSKRLVKHLRQPRKMRHMLQLSTPKQSLIIMLHPVNLLFRSIVKGMWSQVLGQMACHTAVSSWNKKDMLCRYLSSLGEFPGRSGILPYTSYILGNLVSSTGLIMWIGHGKEIRKLMFQALALRRSKGLTLETSAFESLYSGQFTISTQLMKPNYLVILPTDTAPQFR